jgi:hypothetical protein
MFDATTSEPQWHRLLPAQARLVLVTPSLVAMQDETSRKITFFSAVSGQPVTADVPEDYFRALFHPDYATRSQPFRAAHADSDYRDLSIPNPKSMSHYRKHMPPDEHLTVRDPFGHRLTAQATNSWVRITGYYRHLQSTSDLMIISG